MRTPRKYPDTIHLKKEGGTIAELIRLGDRFLYELDFSEPYPLSVEIKDVVLLSDEAQ